MEKILIDNETTALIKGAQAALKLQAVGIVNDKFEANNLKNYSELLLKLSKQLEVRRMELTRPLRDNIYEINEQFSIVRQLDDLSRAANKAVHEWQKSEMQKAADARREQLLSQAPSVPVPVVPEPVKLTKTRKVWRVKILGDIRDVDPQYVTLILDDAKIDAAIKAGRIQIRGLNIYQEEEAVRG